MSCSLLALNPHQENLLRYSRLAKSIKRQTYLFLTGTLPYDDPTTALARLVTACESLLSAENGHWSQQASYQGLQPAVEQTVAFLKAQGIEADEMKLDSVKSLKEEVGDPRTGVLRSTTWNVAKIYKISGQIGQLISKGVPLERVDMLAKATKDARTIEKDITAVMAVTIRVE